MNHGHTHLRKGRGRQVHATHKGRGVYCHGAGLVVVPLPAPRLHAPPGGSNGAEVGAQRRVGLRRQLQCRRRGDGTRFAPPAVRGEALQEDTLVARAGRASVHAQCTAEQPGQGAHCWSKAKRVAGDTHSRTESHTDPQMARRGRRSAEAARRVGAAATSAAVGRATPAAAPSGSGARSSRCGGVLRAGLVRRHNGNDAGGGGFSAGGGPLPGASQPAQQSTRARLAEDAHGGRSNDAQGEARGAGDCGAGDAFAATPAACHACSTACLTADRREASARGSRQAPSGVMSTAPPSCWLSATARCSTKMECCAAERRPDRQAATPRAAEASESTSVCATPGRSHRRCTNTCCASRVGSVADGVDTSPWMTHPLWAAFTATQPASTGGPKDERSVSRRLRCAAAERMDVSGPPPSTENARESENAASVRQRAKRSTRSRHRSSSPRSSACIARRLTGRLCKKLRTRTVVPATARGRLARPTVAFEPRRQMPVSQARLALVSTSNTLSAAKSARVFPACPALFVQLRLPSSASCAIDTPHPLSLHDTKPPAQQTETSTRVAPASRELQTSSSTTLDRLQMEDERRSACKQADMFRTKTSTVSQTKQFTNEPGEASLSLAQSAAFSEKKVQRAAFSRKKCPCVRVVPQRPQARGEFHRGPHLQIREFASESGEHSTPPAPHQTRSAFPMSADPPPLPHNFGICDHLNRRTPCFTEKQQKGVPCAPDAESLAGATEDLRAPLLPCFRRHLRHKSRSVSRPWRGCPRVLLCPPLEKKRAPEARCPTPTARHRVTWRSAAGRPPPMAARRKRSERGWNNREGNAPVCCGGPARPRASRFFCLTRGGRAAASERCAPPSLGGVPCAPDAESLASATEGLRAPSSAPLPTRRNAPAAAPTARAIEARRPTEVPPLAIMVSTPDEAPQERVRREKPPLFFSCQAIDRPVQWTPSFALLRRRSGTRFIAICRPSFAGIRQILQRCAPKSWRRRGYDTPQKPRRWRRYGRRRLRTNRTASAGCAAWKCSSPEWSCTRLACGRTTEVVKQLPL